MSPRRLRRHWESWGVRRRAVVSALVTTTIALLLGGALLVWIMQTRLIGNLGDDTVALARNLAASYSTSSENPPQPRPPSSNTLIVQIIDSTGSVVGSTDPTRASGALLTWEEAQRTGPERRELSGDGGDVIVAAHPFAHNGKEYAAVVAVTTERTIRSIRTVTLVLTAAFPVLLAGVGLGTWALVGSSLRSVRGITSTVRRIRRGQLTTRVTVPPTNDEIAELATTMNAMLARIEQTDAAQRQFVSDASHDLRTPISSILAALEVAKAEGTAQGWADMAPVIEHESARVQHLVNGMLTLARSDDGTLALRQEPVDLDDLLSAQAAALRTRSALRVRTELQPVQVICDPQRTAQVVANIVQNAERHASSMILIRCARDGEEGRIEVVNDGPPIADQDRERVFDRFVRSERSRAGADAGSSGLGLAIARELTEAQGGSISTDATAEGHCRFVVRLPAQPGLSDVDDDEAELGGAG